MKCTGIGKTLLTAFAVLLFFSGCKRAEEKIEAKEAYILGMESYVYGFPLVIMDVTKGVMTAASTPGEYTSPLNQFARMQAYVSPDFKNVVRISLNGLWATAFVDLEKEPYIFSAPDTKGRYYVMQALNMWTDDFASVGSRNTGTGPGNFLIVGPKWNGTVPSDIKNTFRSQTRYAWILVQTVAHGPKDFPAAVAVENGYKLTPLSAWGKPYTPPANVPVDPSINTAKTPFDQLHEMDAGTFFNRLAMLMVDNPPYPADSTRLEMLKKIGVEPGKPFDIKKVDPEIASALNRAVKDAWTKIAEGPLSMKAVNGWVNPLDLGNFKTNYDMRAGIAYLGLGALTKSDAVYPSAFKDGDGNLLDFNAKYRMHFDKGQMLPCGATWSISIYQGNFYVRNPENKYDVAAWMPLKYNRDGSLDIYVQPDSPGKALEANWLPSPPAGPGGMNLTIRCYEPEPSLLDGSYKVPPLTKVQ